MDVVLMKRNGRFSGEAFAVLQMPVQVDMALTKNRQYLGHRWVEVYAAKKEVGSNVWQLGDQQVQAA